MMLWKAATAFLGSSILHPQCNLAIQTSVDSFNNSNRIPNVNQVTPETIEWNFALIPIK